MAKTGLVLEGGAFRGVFTAGVLDFLMKQNIEFDYIVGVSAGAGNAMGFMSHQIGRTKNVIIPDRKITYYGPKQILKHGKFLNLDRMFFEYPYEQFPYEFDKMRKNKTKMEIVVANCDTGEAEYYDERANEQKFLMLGKASCSVPILCAPVKIDKYHYLDGSICDSIPIERALSNGCDKLLVVMTKGLTETPTNYGKGAMKDIMKLRYKRKYPKFYEALLQRTEVYKKELELLNKLENEGKAMIIRPSIDCIKKFEQDTDKTDAFYQNGVDVMKNRYEEFLNFISENEAEVRPIRADEIREAVNR